MLLPFEQAVITYDEAKQLVDFIKKATATPTNPRNVGKMLAQGIHELFGRLEDFVIAAEHYQNNLSYFEPDDYERKRDNY